MSKHRNLVQELNTCKEQLLVLKKAKLNLLTMQHVTEILQENQNLRNELKELASIKEAWLNNTSSSGPKDPVFVKSSSNNSKVSITGSNKPKLSEAEDSTLSNHDTGKHPLPPLEKLTGAEPVPGPKTIKSILKSKSTFKAENLKCFMINKPSSAHTRGNKSSSALAGKLKNVKIKDDPPLVIVIKELNELKFQISKNKSSYFINKNSQQYHTGQGESSSRSRPVRPSIPFPSCIHYGYNDHKYDDCVYYPICEICGSYDHDTHGHNMIIFLRRGIKPRNPQHVIKNYETCGNNVHTTYNHNDIECFKKREALQAKKVESFKASKIESSSALRSKTPTKRKSTLDACELLKGKLVCWSANKQQSVAMFSANAEDIGDVGCCAIILWIKSQITDYDIIYGKPLDELTFKRLIVELGMLNIDSKPKASIPTKEN
nr:retrovirus-related Pol polyprotein from transposon TNT 1-94 [Tanacetum cinerariifolium]